MARCYREDRCLTPIELIDGRIAQLDRLAVEAAFAGSRRADGDRLRLLLAALRALRRNKLGKDAEEGLSGS